MFNYDCAPGVKVSHKFLYPYSEIQLPKKQPVEYIITRRHTRGGAKRGKNRVFQDQSFVCFFGVLLAFEVVTLFPRMPSFFVFKYSLCNRSLRTVFFCGLAHFSCDEI